MLDNVLHSKSLSGASLGSWYYPRADCANVAQNACAMYFLSSFLLPKPLLLHRSNTLPYTILKTERKTSGQMWSRFEGGSRLKVTLASFQLHSCTPMCPAELHTLLAALPHNELSLLSASLRSIHSNSAVYILLAASPPIVIVNKLSLLMAFFSSTKMTVSLHWINRGCQN